MPVIMSLQVRGGKSLKYKGSGDSIDFKRTDNADNKAAAWYGFARFYLGQTAGRLNQVLIDARQPVDIA